MNKLSNMNTSEVLSLSVSELLSQEILLDLYDISDIAERTRLKALLSAAAKKQGIDKDFKAVLNAYDEEDERLGREYAGASLNTTDFSFQPYELCCGTWVADDNGIRQMNKSGDWVYASKIPVVPTAILENVSTGVEKVKLEYFKNGQKSLVCERSVTASASSIVKLADKGLEVNSENAKLLVRYISECITRNLDVLPCLKATSQLGWCNDKFAPYDSDIVFDGENENKQLYRSVAENGSFELWKETTGILRGNVAVRLMMAASFASVLIEKVNALPFVFHLWGLTGTGKTVALMIAMSVWGNPEPTKMVRTLNMTQNALMSTAAFLKNLPFAGDELQTIKNRWDGYDQLVMRVTEGIDRGRMNFDKISETKSWRCAFIFTGEEPIVKSSSGGGVTNRVLEMEVSGSLINGFSGNEVVNILNENHGHAGKIFIEHIKKAENIDKQFQSLSSEILKTTNTTDKQAASLALMLLADKFACECIYTDETPLKVESAVFLLSSADEVDIAERAYEFIINHIAQNRNRFIADGNHGEIWGVIREDENIFFNVSVLKRELSANGFEFDAVKKKWAEKQYLIKNSTGRYVHCTTVNGTKANYVNLRFVGVAEDSADTDEDDEFEIPFPGD